MHKGFYTKDCDLRNMDFCFLEDEIIEDDISAFNFLHGFCDVFAYKLYDIFSYDLECIMDEHGLIHAYCKKIINGKTSFIDVRGITDNYEEFINEFGDFIDYFDEPIYPITGTIKMDKLKESEISNKSSFEKYSKAAEKLILTYKNYYLI